MKITHFLFALSLMALTACSSTKAPQSRKDLPETVMVTYHVKPSMDAVLQDVLTHAWEAYRKEHLVLAEPHTIIEDQDGNGKIRIIEIFTWVNHSAPEHVPDSVKQMWARMQGLCEPRNGHNGLEGGEVELLVPKTK